MQTAQHVALIIQTMKESFYLTRILMPIVLPFEVERHIDNWAFQEKANGLFIIVIHIFTVVRPLGGQI